MRVDFFTLQLIVATAEQASLTGGADQVHITLPAASRRIKDAEARLGCSLFERHRRGVRLTSAGLLFLEHARRVLTAADALEAGMQLASRQSRH